MYENMNLLYKLFEKLLGKNTLYYPGCFTKKMLPEIEINYEKILKDLGVNFIKLKDFEYCCGSPILRAGMKNDFEEIKKKNIEIFKSHQVGLIITNCPACFNMFKFEYKLENYGIQVEHITQTINKKQKQKREKIQNDIFYHDPCHLGRLSNVYDEPRFILRNSGYNVCEFSKNRENSLCCGGGGGLINNNPELSKQIAKETLSQLPSDSVMTSPCPMCFYQFKNNTENINVKEFSEIILDQDGK